MVPGFADELGMKCQPEGKSRRYISNTKEIIDLRSTMASTEMALNRYESPGISLK
jgi:hypothetical protein